MGWLRLVGSSNLQVSFAKEPYKRDNILQKGPIILRSLLFKYFKSILLTVVTPYAIRGDPWKPPSVLTWTLGAGGRDPSKQKDFCTTVKKLRQIFFLASDVGVCYSITGTRFPYYISLGTILWAHNNRNVLVQIKTKHGFEIETMKSGYRQSDICLHISIYIYVCTYLYIHTPHVSLTEYKADPRSELFEKQKEEMVDSNNYKCQKSRRVWILSLSGQWAGELLCEWK